MGDIVLIRHGQANSLAKSEEEYDRLSDLGQQQAAWLGDWLRAHEEPFDRVVSGTMQRQIQTAAAMGYAEAPTDPRLNEMDYFSLGRALTEVHGVPHPGPENFAQHSVKVMEAWHAAEIKSHESFEAFEARVRGIVEEAAEPGVRVLCVTSSGVIGMALRALLGLDARRLAQVLLPIRNSSVHRMRVTPHGTILAGFNATPHLDAPDRAHARTTY